MKTILIEQVANGWIVRDRDDCSLNSYKPGDVHVYRSIRELQDDLGCLLLGGESIKDTSCPAPDEIRAAHRKVMDKMYPPPLFQA